VFDFAADSPARETISRFDPRTAAAVTNLLRLTGRSGLGVGQDDWKVKRT